MDILNISVEGKKIIVSAKSKRFDPRTNPRVRIKTSDVKKHLEEKGFLLEECMQSAELNNSDVNKLEATWIFREKACAKPKPKKIDIPISVSAHEPEKPTAKKTTRRRTTKKAFSKNKVVDNSSKDVILPIEDNS